MHRLVCGRMNLLRRRVGDRQFLLDVVRGILELTDALAETSRDLGDALGAENKKNNEEYESNLPGAKTHDGGGRVTSGCDGLRLLRFASGE